jgi:hypothetical protein
MNELIAILKRGLGLRKCVPSYEEVERPSVPAWRAECRDDCTIYSGVFVVFGARGHPVWRVPGRIVEWPRLPTDVYIWNPPRAVKQHPKGSCLQLVRPNDSWFKLHWERPAQSFEASRAYVEQLLGEAHLRRKR